MIIGFVGSGNMARALALGFGEPALFSDHGSGRAASLAELVGGEAVGSNRELGERAELVVLAHKPAQLDAVAREVGPATVVLSLLGRVTVEQLAGAYPGAQIVRAMPNTASAIRAGVTCVCGAELQDVEELLGRVGMVVRLEERLMDAATAVSGVAPAYVALLAEAWIDAAVGQGIPASQAAALVGGALAGSAALLQARDMDTLGVRREVTSPGGMTARGLRALEHAGLRSAFADAAAAVAGPSTT
ncbi:MAG: pyrroline-5-carboxylate reductase dimerization domain-containing protein [Solirubrobacteraceae bacterium]|jgi:pyrroline-5-carboxylate reductase